MGDQWIWCLERAERCLQNGDFDAALSLLRCAETAYPHAPGLPEILAIAHVFHHASSSPNARSACPHRNPPTNWYHVLKWPSILRLEYTNSNGVRPSKGSLATGLHLSNECSLRSGSMRIPMLILLRRDIVNLHYYFIQIRTSTG